MSKFVFLCKHLCKNQIVLVGRNLRIVAQWCTCVKAICWDCTSVYFSVNISIRVYIKIRFNNVKMFPFSVKIWIIFYIEIRFYISQMFPFSANGPKVGRVAPPAAIYIEGATLCPPLLLFSLFYKVIHSEAWYQPWISNSKIYENIWIPVF